MQNNHKNNQFTNQFKFDVLIPELKTNGYIIKREKRNLILRICLKSMEALRYFPQTRIMNSLYLHIPRQVIYQVQNTTGPLKANQYIVDNLSKVSFEKKIMLES